MFLDIYSCRKISFLVACSKIKSTASTSGTVSTAATSGTGTTCGTINSAGTTSQAAEEALLAINTIAALEAQIQDAAKGLSNNGL